MGSGTDRRGSIAVEPVLAQLLLVMSEQADALDQLPRLHEAKVQLMREAHRHGLTMDQIAGHCGISPQRVQQLIRGRTPKESQ